MASGDAGSSPTVRARQARQLARGALAGLEAAGRAARAQGAGPVPGVSDLEAALRLTQVGEPDLDVFQNEVAPAYRDVCAAKYDAEAAR